MSTREQIVGRFYIEWTTPKQGKVYNRAELYESREEAELAAERIKAGFAPHVTRHFMQSLQYRVVTVAVRRTMHVPSSWTKPVGLPAAAQREFDGFVAARNQMGR